MSVGGTLWNCRTDFLKIRQKEVSSNVGYNLCWHHISKKIAASKKNSKIAIYLKLLGLENEIFMIVTCDEMKDKHF